jgi:lysyl-tRNA synthetase class 1
MSTIDPLANPSDLRALAEQSNAWPFEQAKAIVARLKKKPKDEVLFETGYGPSGLPHIGTFGEVARTTMVRHAFRVLTEDKVKTRLLAFSDDMDGLRKVPDNVPNKEMLTAYLGKPLTRIPDPFSNEFPSFGAANNARLRAFLDRFNFDYEFASSTDYYTSGRFDAAMQRMLEVYDRVMDIILPTLGPDRRATYSPFLPISPATGKVLYVPMIERNVSKGTVVYVDPDTGEKTETTVTGGQVKCQWKADWAMRWFALGVDYEMAGKDLIDSVKLSGRICTALGGAPPEGFNYELFLDEQGQKISKSKGNGLTIDEWLRYASPESLSLFMYREPKAAKRLHFDVIPRNVDDYQQFLDGFSRQDAKQQLANPAWHIHAGHPPAADSPVTFQLLLTLVSSSNAENASTLWGFIGRYRPGVTPKTHPKLDAMVGYAINYYRDFVAPTKKFREPTSTERVALQDLRDALSQLPPEASAEEIQNVVYEIGRREPFLDAVKKGKDGRPGVSLEWFNMLYQVLLGQEKGPRFGSFVAVYGLPNAVAMIDGALARSAKPEPNNAEAIRKIAEQALQDALEIYQLIALLRAKYTDGVNSSLAKVGAVTASDTLENALISRLVILVMRAYDEPRPGEQNLRAAVEMLKTDQTAREIFDLGQKVKKVADFEEQWTKCFGDHRRPKIKNLRDKRTAHLGVPAEDIAEAEYRELFEFGEATAHAMELLALGTGVAVKPVTGNNNAVAEADTIWKPWQVSRKSPD